MNRSDWTHLALNGAQVHLLRLDAEGVVREALGSTTFKEGDALGRDAENAQQVREAAVAAAGGKPRRLNVVWRGGVYDARFAPALKDGSIPVSACYVPGPDLAEQARQLRASVFEASGVPMALVDLRWGIVTANAAFKSAYGLPADAAAGRDWSRGLSEDGRRTLEHAAKPALEKTKAWCGMLSHRVAGKLRTHLVHFNRAPDNTLVCVSLDQTEARRKADETAQMLARERTARTLAELNRRDYEFLDQISRLLDDEPGFPEGFSTVARAVLGFAGDFCAVYLSDGGRTYRTVAVEHMDERFAAELRELRAAPGEDVEGDGPVAAAIRNAVDYVEYENGSAALSRCHRDGRLKRLLRGLDLESLMIVPMIGHHGPVGALTLGARRGGRRYDVDDLNTARDLARRVTMRYENAKLRASLERMDRFKTDLLMSAGHDLRAPLQAALAYTSLLEENVSEGLDAQSRDFLDQIKGAVGSLDRMIKSLLNVSRLSYDGNGESRTDLAAVLRECAEPFTALAERAGVTLSARIAAGPAAAVDDLDIRRVAQNLLENAIKYTPRGGHVEVRTVVNAPWVGFEVADDGRGLPPEALGKIFDAGYRVPGSDGAAPGQGLGLHTCAELVRGCGGRIEAESAGPGRGTTFRVYFRAVHENAAAPEQEART